MTEKTVGLIITARINNHQVGEWKKVIGIEQTDIELNQMVVSQGSSERRL
jgi:hypothetical protein